MLGSSYESKQISFVIKIKENSRFSDADYPSIIKEELHVINQLNRTLKANSQSNTKSLKIQYTLKDVEKIKYTSTRQKHVQT